MGKKEKKVVELAEELKTLVTIVPKLEALVKVHNEIAAGYQKYRKNGGTAIPGIEKHLGVKEQKNVPSEKTKTKETVTKKEVNVPEETTEMKKNKKKVK